MEKKVLKKALEGEMGDQFERSAAIWNAGVEDVDVLTPEEAEKIIVEGKSPWQRAYIIETPEELKEMIEVRWEQDWQDAWPLGLEAGIPPDEHPTWASYHASIGKEPQEETADSEPCPPMKDFDESVLLCVLRQRGLCAKKAYNVLLERERFRVCHKCNMSEEEGRKFMEEWGHVFVEPKATDRWDRKIVVFSGAEVSKKENLEKMQALDPKMIMRFLFWYQEHIGQAREIDQRLSNMMIQDMGDFSLSFITFIKLHSRRQERTQRMKTKDGRPLIGHMMRYACGGRLGTVAIVRPPWWMSLIIGVAKMWMDPIVKANFHSLGGRNLIKLQEMVEVDTLPSYLGGTREGWMM